MRFAWENEFERKFDLEIFEGDLVWVQSNSHFLVKIGKCPKSAKIDPWVKRLNFERIERKGGQVGPGKYSDFLAGLGEKILRGLGVGFAGVVREVGWVAAGLGAEEQGQGDWVGETGRGVGVDGWVV